MLTFNIKGYIDPDSTKKNGLARVDVTIDGIVTPLTTKDEIEEHLLKRNPQSYCASGTIPFLHTDLRQAIGPTGDSPHAESILDGSLTHPDLAVWAFTSQLCLRSHYPDTTKATVTERHLSIAFGGLHKKSASSPPGPYNAH
jgi:hypothetical protein